MPTITVQVAASADDCWRRLDASLFNTNNVVVSAGSGSASFNQIGSGMRFQGVAIPQGATIASAYLQIRREAGNATGNDCNTRISAEDVDDAGDFSGDDAASFDVRWATRTTAKVDWDGIASWESGIWYNSPEIKTVIKEIVDRVGWVSGNDIVIFWEDFDDRSDNSAVRGGASYDGDTATAPKLVVVYATIFPTDAITRVTNIIHRYNRKEQVYSMEVSLGEVTTDFGLPEWLSKPMVAVTPKSEEPATQKTVADEVKKVVETERSITQAAPTPVSTAADLLYGTPPTGPSVEATAPLQPPIAPEPIIDIAKVSERTKDIMATPEFKKQWGYSSVEELKKQQQANKKEKKFLWWSW